MIDVDDETMVVDLVPLRSRTPTYVGVAPKAPRRPAPMRAIVRYLAVRKVVALLREHCSFELVDQEIGDNKIYRGALEFVMRRMVEFPLWAYAIKEMMQAELWTFTGHTC